MQKSLKISEPCRKTHLWLPLGRGRNEVGVCGYQMQTIIYRMEKQLIYKIQLYSPGNHIQYPVINHNRKVYEKNIYIHTYIYIYIYIHIYICVAESLCYAAEINTTLQINYTSIKDIFKRVPELKY